MELFLIDSYVTPEKPYTFNLSFYTTENVKSKVIIDQKYEIEISEEYTTDHVAEIDFTEFQFSNKFIPFVIISEFEDGITKESETFEIVLPYEEFIETKEGEDPVSTILIGFLLYLIPSPNILITERENYFSLTKEFPLVTFYSSGYSDPSGSITIEYTHIYESYIDNYLRLGYKQFFPIPVFEYLSPGLTGFTNFNGFNGVGTEISLGLFNIYDVFTVYSRYRFNFKPDETDLNFH
ncbi:MAG: hypothetical protein R3250_13635, partial [Melioribacteraceae bacterium]|nr:hypothetical protein [Melioribacteraceae bacterium]